MRNRNNRFCSPPSYSSLSVPGDSVVLKPHPPASVLPPSQLPLNSVSTPSQLPLNSVHTPSPNRPSSMPGDSVAQVRRYVSVDISSRMCKFLSVLYCGTD